MRVLHVYDLHSFLFPIKNYLCSYSYSAEYCSELFGIQPNTDKNSSGDEIANVNFYTVRPGSYRKSL